MPNACDCMPHSDRRASPARAVALANKIKKRILGKTPEEQEKCEEPGCTFLLSIGSGFDDKHEDLVSVLKVEQWQHEYDITWKNCSFQFDKKPQWLLSLGFNLSAIFVAKLCMRLHQMCVTNEDHVKFTHRTAAIVSNRKSFRAPCRRIPESRSVCN